MSENQSIEHPSWSVQVSPDGPYVISGTGATIRDAVIATNEQGVSVRYQLGNKVDLVDGTRLCRCGHSKTKPYCDGSHETVKVNLTETAATDPYSPNPDVIPGPELTLRDDESLCAYARFCDAGERVWTEVTLDGTSHTELVEHIARSCPGGRLLISDSESGEALTSTQDRGIYAIEDPKLGVHGPLMLAGSVQLTSAHKTTYEVRASQALCRCGRSSNKPFCDGSHAAQ